MKDALALYVFAQRRLEFARYDEINEAEATFHASVCEVRSSLKQMTGLTNSEIRIMVDALS